DTLGDGVETVILDGSQSSDEDGDIVSFSWIIADSVVASAVTGEIDLPVGNHEVVLLVMDDMGNTGSDTVNITILESPVGIDAMDILTNLRVYPNPFVDEVTIEYFLEKPGLVRIDLMDVTGRWMQSLVDSELIEGRHSILLNGQSLESGTYYLRFNCDNKNLGDKVLIKE
ncbi:MAG: T9SS type A sorting domain-containing protein, partial [Bacteroidota bacterium]